MIDIQSGTTINTFSGISECDKKNGCSCSWSICHFYNKCHFISRCQRGFQKTYRKKYIFIFEEDKEKLDEFLIIAKTDYKNQRSKKVYQLDKDTGEIINTFSSGGEASRTLNIVNSGINQCCQYYKYNDETRPKCYQLKTYKGFVFKQSLEIHES